MIRKVLDRFDIHSTKDLLAFVGQVLKFGIVGVMNTLISLMVYWGLCHVGVHYVPAFALGEIVSILNAYFWNNLVVFRKQENETRNHAKSMVRVFVIYISTFLLAEGLLILQVQYLGWSEQLAPVLNLLLTIPINFLLNKFWAFRDEKQ